MKRAVVSFDDTILCEDVRKESNGKFILIGGMALDLVFPNYPTDFAAVVHCEGTVHSAGIIEPSLVVEDTEGGMLFNTANFGPMPKLTLIRGRFAVDIPIYFTANRSTTLVFTANDGERSHLLFRRRVMLGDEANAENEVLKKELQSEDETDLVG